MVKDKISLFWEKERKRIMNEIYTDEEERALIETVYEYSFVKDGKKRVTTYSWRNGRLKNFAPDGEIFSEEYEKGYKESFLAHLKDCK